MRMYIKSWCQCRRKQRAFEVSNIILRSQVKSFHSWSSHLFCGPSGGRCHLRSGRLSDTLMWSWRAMFAGVLSSSRATCQNTETRQRDRRWGSEVRPVRCSISPFRTWSYHQIPSSCLRHLWWKASRVLTCLLIVRSTCLWHIVKAYSNIDNQCLIYTELRVECHALIAPYPF